jgi:hypothetical protein
VDVLNIVSLQTCTPSREVDNIPSERRGVATPLLSAGAGACSRHRHRLTTLSDREHSMATSPRWDPAGHPVHRLIQFLDTLAVSVVRFQQTTFFAPFFRGRSDRDDYDPDRRREALMHLHAEYRVVTDRLFPRENGSPQHAAAALADAAVAYFVNRGRTDAERWVREAAVWIDSAGRWTPQTGEPSGGEWPKQNERFKQQQDAVLYMSTVRANLFAELSRCGEVAPAEIYGRVDNAPVPPLPPGKTTISVEELTRWADAARPGGTSPIRLPILSPTEKEQPEVAPTAETTEIDRPFLIRDLLAWAGVRDLAEQAIQPGFDPRTIGIIHNFNMPVPMPGFELPNGFRYPPSAPQPTRSPNGIGNFLPAATFIEVVSHYRGPDPTCCPAFVRLEALAMREGGEIDVPRVTRWIGELCFRRGISRSQADHLPVSELLSPTVPVLSAVHVPAVDVHLDPATFVRGKADLASVRQLAMTNTVMNELYVAPLGSPLAVSVAGESSNLGGEKGERSQQAEPDGPYEQGGEFGLRINGKKRPFQSWQMQPFKLIRHMWPPVDGKEYSVNEVKKAVGSKAMEPKWATNEASKARKPLGLFGVPFTIEASNERGVFWWLAVPAGILAADRENADTDSL